jgi:hypothetical protein
VEARRRKRRQMQTMELKVRMDCASSR